MQCLFIMVGTMTKLIEGILVYIINIKKKTLDCTSIQEIPLVFGIANVRSIFFLQCSVNNL